MTTRVVLDTGVLWRPQALRALAEDQVPVILPAVAFAERARQYRKRGWKVGRLRRELREFGVEVEPMGEVEAERFAPTVLDDNQWRRLSRDAFISGHVRPGDELWTTNPRDFLSIGVPEKQVVAV